VEKVHGIGENSPIFKNLIKNSLKTLKKAEKDI